MDKPVQKFKVRIDPRLLKGEEVEMEFAPMDIPLLGGWTDDPGEGRAVLLPDGREVLNPVPMAPPVGYRPEPTMMEMMQRMINNHNAMLRDDEEVDSIDDANDFDIPDELEPSSYYEVEMMDEFPSVPPEKEEAEPVVPPPAQPDIPSEKK